MENEIRIICPNCGRVVALNKAGNVKGEKGSTSPYYIGECSCGYRIELEDDKDKGEEKTFLMIRLG